MPSAPVTARALMFQGTGTDVGKSLLVAGLGRAYTRRGLAVRPFKPQNMSNNAAVTADGGEIGRAQALQARACGILPTVDMNPVLLKPQAESGSQVVVQGRVVGSSNARDYYKLKPSLMPRAMDSFGRLAADADLVLVEGAGSPAEINLRDGDIANMGFACAARVPVVLAADIDKGGVIAALVGTCALLTEEERSLLAGYVVNKFRGDISLFDDGLAAIGAHTGLDCFGVVPWFDDAHRLPAEDAMGLAPSDAAARPRPANAIKIAVPRLSRIANFDDLDPLRAEPDVTLEIVPAGRPLPADADVILLPGSKTTLSDLAQLRTEGWDIDILAHARRGGLVVGLCAGFQMLGRSVADPDGTEGRAGTAPGLGLLDVETELAGDKRLEAAEGVDLATGAAVAGYEMHVGRTAGPGLERPMLRLGTRYDGAVSAGGNVMGCYLHGLFAADGFRSAFLDAIAGDRAAHTAFEAGVETALDGLADHLEASLDLDRLLDAAAVPQTAGR